MRDVLWTASCLDPVADFDGHDVESVVIEAAPASFSVADIDSLELAQHDDLNDPDESDDTADVNDCKMLGGDDDALTKTSCNAIIAISMFMIILANVSAKSAMPIENSKINKNIQKKQKKKMRRQQNKTDKTK